MEATLGAIASGEFQTTLRQQVFTTIDGRRFQASLSQGRVGCHSLLARIHLLLAIALAKR
ncbi:MAG: hypothetical protein AB1589_00075 [Cyanobacteriota bacterium]